jgi:hypothetical protein
MRHIFILALVLIGSAVNASPAVIGSVAIDTPVLQQPDRIKDRSPMFHYALRFPALIGSVALVSSGDIQLRAGAPFYDENKVRVGFELPAGSLVPYVTWERRYSINDNRFIAGIKLNFRG